MSLDGRKRWLALLVLCFGDLMIVVYAIVNGNETGWTSARTIGLLVAAAALLALFLAIEARARSPLMPLGLFRLRNLSTANVVGILMAGGMFAVFFLSALYLQQVLGYTPLEVGLAYLPSTVIWGAVSFGLSDKLVMRFGIKPPLLAGLSLMAVGGPPFPRAPAGGRFVVGRPPALCPRGRKPTSPRRRPPARPEAPGGSRARGAPRARAAGRGRPARSPGSPVEPGRLRSKRSLRRHTAGTALKTS